MIEHPKTKARLGEESYRIILENIEDPVAVCDSVDSLLYFNSAYQRVFIDNPGYSPVIKSTDGRDSKCPYCETNSHTGVREPVSLGEFRHKGRFYRHTTSTLPSTNGVVFCLHLFRDISDRIEKERELAGAIERAERADKLKNSFLANISHEVRTPMNAIVGFSDLLSVENTSEEDRGKYISIIRSSSDTLLKIVDNIIVYSRIRSGDLSFNFTNIQIARLINEVTFAFRQKVSDDPKNISINTDIPAYEVAPMVYSDYSILTNILHNLLDNAWKFTGHGRIDIGYRVLESHPGRVVRFFVRDTGIGIPENSHSIIFEPFRQVEDAETKRYSGTGLGLSIVRELLQQMGSDVSFISSAGDGSEFRFEIRAVN